MQYDFLRSIARLHRRANGKTRDRTRGINGERASGALVHGLRHTFATELANINVSVYTLMNLLGHESMVTSQRYVDGAGTETRSAAKLNPLYDLFNVHQRHS